MFFPDLKKNVSKRAQIIFEWALSHSFFFCCCCCCEVTDSVLPQYITWMILTWGVELPGCIDPSLPSLDDLRPPLNRRHNAGAAVLGSLRGVRGVKPRLMHDGTIGGGVGGSCVKGEGLNVQACSTLSFVFALALWCHPHNLWLLVNKPTGPLWRQWGRQEWPQAVWEDESLVQLDPMFAIILFDFFVWRLFKKNGHLFALYNL